MASVIAPDRLPAESVRKRSSAEAVDPPDGAMVRPCVSRQALGNSEPAWARQVMPADGEDSPIRARLQPAQLFGDPSIDHRLAVIHLRGH